MHADTLIGGDQDVDLSSHLSSAIDPVEPHSTLTTLNHSMFDLGQSCIGPHRECHT